jgi:hypothetical protein
VFDRPITARFGVFHSFAPPFPSSGRNLGVLAAKVPASQYQIGEAEQREQLSVVLRKAPVTGFTMGTSKNLPIHGMMAAHQT